MIGLLLLKHIYGLSDEGVCERWVHDPYFQYFTGEEFFAHAFPHERSGMTHWRQRIGDKLDALLAESLRVAHDTGALKAKDLERVTVDTTVQPKNITFPTDAKQTHKAIVMLGGLAKTHGVPLRQSYVRASSSFMPRHCTAIPMTGTPLGPCSRSFRHLLASKPNASMSTRAIEATMRQSHCASIAQDRSAASSVSSNRNSGGDPPSRQSSATSSPTAISAATSSRDRRATTPMPSTQRPDTISGSFSNG